MDAERGTKIFAVAGNPILHSRSPQLMNCAFEALGIDAVYTRMLAGSGGEVVQTAREIGIGGLNITTPFKGEVPGHLDEISAEAKKLGAVNAIVFEGEESVGHNTDYLGVIGALENAGVEIKGKKAVVLGAGGAGRAAAFGLQNRGAEVVVLNRTREKAEEAAEIAGGRAGGMEVLGEELEAADILVSCLSPNANVVETGMLGEEKVVLDANYNSSVLEGTASEAGCRFIDGREWLLAQAVPSFELFVGKKAPIDAMREAVYGEGEPGGGTRGEGGNEYGEGTLENGGRGKNIALIGFMGSGKSAVAGELAKKSGKKEVSTDSEIEKNAKKSIREIFAEIGEEGFRGMEREEIAKAGKFKGGIIDCGGGAILDGGNVETLRETCTPVWLWATPETAVGRLEEDGGRPLLEADSEERLNIARKINSGRKGKYAKAAEMIISTEKRNAGEIAEMILHETGKTN